MCATATYLYPCQLKPIKRWYESTIAAVTAAMFSILHSLHKYPTISGSWWALQNNVLYWQKRNLKAHISPICNPICKHSWHLRRNLPPGAGFLNTFSVRNPEHLFGQRFSLAPAEVCGKHAVRYICTTKTGSTDATGMPLPRWLNFTSVGALEGRGKAGRRVEEGQPHGWGGPKRG